MNKLVSPEGSSYTPLKARMSIVFQDDMSHTLKGSHELVKSLFDYVDEHGMMGVYELIDEDFYRDKGGKHKSGKMLINMERVSYIVSDYY